MDIYVSLPLITVKMQWMNDHIDIVTIIIHAKKVNNLLSLNLIMAVSNCDIDEEGIQISNIFFSGANKHSTWYGTAVSHKIEVELIINFPGIMLKCFPTFCCSVITNMDTKMTTCFQWMVHYVWLFPWNIIKS